MIKAEVSLKAKDPESLELIKTAIIDLVSHIPQMTTDNKGQKYYIFNAVPIKWNKLEIEEVK